MALVKLEPKDYIDVPTFPDFPEAEWKGRINRAKELMSENEIDALVVWKRENVRYFFGFQTGHWGIPSLQPAVGIIPVDGEPLLIVPTLFVGNAQGFCWTRNIRYQERAHEVPEERALPKEVATIIKEIGCGQKNIALEMGFLGCMWIPRPLNDIEAFKAALPDARFVDGDKVIWGCRMIKSPLEVDRIRQACGVLAECYSAVIEQYRPGMSEMDVGKIILRVQVESGDFRGGDTIIAGHVGSTQKGHIYDCLALDDVMITNNDHIALDLQHKHKGYWSDITRILRAGPIPDRLKRDYELTVECIDNAAGMIRPGVKANEIYKAAVEPLQHAGITRLPDMTGHGIGMDIHEPPSLDNTNEMLLQEGMVLALEVGAGEFGLEDQYIVTDKGSERIEGLNKSIVQVSHPFS